MVDLTAIDGVLRIKDGNQFVKKFNGKDRKEINLYFNAIYGKSIVDSIIVTTEESRRINIFI